MCIGCRRRRKKEEMIRITKSVDGMALIDEKKHLNGRGFYLCPNRMCLEMAWKKNRMGRITGMEESSVSFESRWSYLVKDM